MTFQVFFYFDTNLQDVFIVFDVCECVCVSKMFKIRILWKIFIKRFKKCTRIAFDVQKKFSLILTSIFTLAIVNNNKSWIVDEFVCV